MSIQREKPERRALDIPQLDQPCCKVTLEDDGTQFHFVVKKPIIKPSSEVVEPAHTPEDSIH